MKTFHLYLFRDKLNGPVARVIVCRTQLIDPDSYSPGACEYKPIEARDYRVAGQSAYQYGPQVFGASGEMIRRKG